MTEERLAEIKAHLYGCEGLSASGTGCIDCQADTHQLLDEVHRLRRALQLSEASRGVPSKEYIGMTVYPPTGRESPRLLGIDAEPIIVPKEV